MSFLLWCFHILHFVIFYIFFFVIFSLDIPPDIWFPCPGLQNTPLWLSVPHLKRNSIHQGSYWVYGRDGSLMDPCYANKVDVATVHISVHLFLLWQWNMCGRALFWWNITFFLAKPDLFSHICCCSWSRRLAYCPHVIVWPVGI